MITQASFEGFLTIFFGFIFIIFLLIIALRLLFPIVLRYLLKKAQKKIELFNSEKHSQQRAATNQNQKPISTKKVGEYIDYEEID